MLGGPLTGKFEASISWRHEMDDRICRRRFLLQKSRSFSPEGPVASYNKCGSSQILEVISGPHFGSAYVGRVSFRLPDILHTSQKVLSSPSLRSARRGEDRERPRHHL